MCALNGCKGSELASLPTARLTHLAPVALNAAEFITHARLILRLHLHCEELKVLTELQSDR